MFSTVSLITCKQPFWNKSSSFTHNNGFLLCLVYLLLDCLKKDPDYLNPRTSIKEPVKFAWNRSEQKSPYSWSIISAHDDGGPRSRVCKRSAPHQHGRKLYSARFCRVIFKHLPQSLTNHIWCLRPLWQLISPIVRTKSAYWGGRGVTEFFLLHWNPNIFVT